MTRNRRKPRPWGLLIWMGIIAGVIYWILEAAVGAIFFAEQPFVQVLVNPSSHEIWMRSIAVGLLVLLGIVAQTVLNRKARVDEERQWLNRVFRAIRKVNQVLVRAEDRDSMLTDVCHTLIETRGYHNAWIAIRDTDGTFSHTAEAGRSEQFSLLQEKLRTGWLPSCGEKALSSSTPVVVEEPPWNCLDCPSAEQYAGRAAIACRLRHADETYGFLCASVSMDAADDERERALFKEISDDIAFVLHKMAMEEQQARGERALRESERRYRAIVENSHDGIYIYRGTEFLFVNDRAAEITGYTKEELYDMNPFKLFHPDDRERVEDIGRRRAQGEDVPNTYQARVISKQGAVKYCEFAVTSITYKGEYAALASVRDITRQKQAEEGLREREERLGLVLEGAEAGLWDWDVQTGETVFNERWAEIVGYELEELEPVSIETWKELCHSEDLEKSNELLEKHWNGETDFYECEVRMKHKDGHWIWIRDRGKVVEWDDEGNPIRMTGTHLDITERKQAEQAMERALEKERVFKLKTSHHFFNPIAISKGYMDIAMEEMPEEHKDTIQQARDALMRVQRVVENVVERGEIHE